MNHRAIALIVLAFLLSACGSASDAVTFQAPSDYKPDVSIGPFAQVWSGPAHSIIMLMALPTKLDLSKPITETPVENAKFQRDEMITICGSQPARYGEMEGQAPQSSSSPAATGKNATQEIEFVATAVNGKTYMALYTRPLGTAVDSSAQAAIRNICPRSRG